MIQSFPVLPGRRAARRSLRAPLLVAVAGLLAMSGAVAAPADDVGTGDDGGRQQQRHPALPEQQPASPDNRNAGVEADVAEDGDLFAEQRAMDQARGLTPTIRAHALNESSGHDLVPGL